MVESGQVSRASHARSPFLPSVSSRSTARSDDEFPGFARQSDLERRLIYILADIACPVSSELTTIFQIGLHLTSVAALFVSHGLQQ